MVHRWGLEIFGLITSILNVNYRPHIVTEATQKSVCRGTFSLRSQGQILVLVNTHHAVGLRPILVNILLDFLGKVGCLSISMKIIIPSKYVFKVIIDFLCQIKPVFVYQRSSH